MVPYRLVYATLLTLLHLSCIYNFMNTFCDITAVHCYLYPSLHYIHVNSLFIRVCSQCMQYYSTPKQGSVYSCSLYSTITQAHNYIIQGAITAHAWRVGYIVANGYVLKLQMNCLYFSHFKENAKQNRSCVCNNT